MPLKQIAELRGHQDRVWSVAWSPDGVLASSSGDGDVRLWAETAGGWKCTQVLSEHKRTVRHTAWAHDGLTLACACFDGTASMWKKGESGEFEVDTLLEGHDNEVKCVSFDVEDRYIGTCSRDKSVWVWEHSDGEYECCAVLTGHAQDVKCVAWHPSRKLLFSCSYDDTIKVWAEDPSARDDWYCHQTLVGHSSTVWLVTFECFPEDAAHEVSANPRMVSCSDDGTLIVWQGQPAADGGGLHWRRACTLQGHHPRTVFGCDWSRNGLIATACGDDGIRIFAPRTMDVDEGACGFDLCCAKELAHEADVNSVRWHPRRPDILASASDDGTVRLWQYSTD
eukprot:TRINITY_DN65563_c0_g1_i1.p1 TRINITY_DN65563_c0_g1~~TRINITY_DN65563_c0_g1_i1.p1  ORF type:complete len:363 (+),score=100.11 TRINITY_DN65563_c0_g1_i1:78-1091(+)